MSKRHTQPPADLCQGSPEQASLLPARLTFSWFTRFVRESRGSRPVSKESLLPLGRDMRSKELSDTFEAHWDGQAADAAAAQSPNRLLRCIAALHRGAFVRSAVLHVIAGTSLQLTPFAMNYFLQVMEDREHGVLDPARWYHGYLGCGAMALLLLVKALLGNQGSFVAYKAGLKIRSSLSSAIYCHLLEVSNGSKQAFSVGKTVKLVSADILKALSVLDYLHFVWLGPFQIVFTFVMVYLSIGWPALLSLGLLCLAIPVQVLLTRCLIRNRRYVGEATDRRIRALQEMVLGIRVIKMYCWEELFLRRLEDCRQEELRLILRQNMIYGCSIVLSVTVPAFSTVVTFVAYSMAGNSLVAHVVSPVCLYFSMLDIPLFNIPLFINTAVDMRASLARIQGFLMSESLDSDVVRRDGAEMGLAIEEGDFDWDASTRKKQKKRLLQKKLRPLVPGHIDEAHPPCRMLTITPTTTYDMQEHTWLDPSDKQADAESSAVFCIRDVELKVPRGRLVAIVGPVGSGKSSLLSAILGEMKSDGGSRVQVGGALGYSPQQAWIMNGTLRENILFGRAFDEARYLTVLKQCAIDTDIAALPEADLTVVGEKGIALSGGQKARINLARVVYANPDVVLLDDPLSAVDARVGNVLFYKCIRDGLLRDKTRILATHQLAIVPFVDYVVVMRHGRVAEQGTYDELVARNSTFAQMMERFIHTDALNADEELEELLDTDELSVDEPSFEESSLVLRAGPAAPEVSKMVTGKQRPGTYGVYFGAAGGTAMVLLALAVIAGDEFFRAGNDLWLTVWMMEAPWALSQAQYRLVYCLFAVGLTLLTWACVLTFTLGGIAAARHFHSTAVHRLFRAPLGFFEATTIGRIVNRFSRDQEVIDTQLSDCIYFFMYIVGTLLSTYLFLLLVSWQMAVVLSAAFGLVLVLQAVYSTSNWKVNKLYNQALSPFLRQVTETYAGLSVIRVFGNEPQMAAKYHAASDSVTAAAYMSMALKRWTSVRVELLGAALVLGVSGLAYGLRISSQLTGKIIEFTMLAIGFLDYFVRQWAELETNILSVDRVHAYATTLDIEALDETRLPDLDPAWPRSGALEIRGLTVAYKPHLPPVVHGVSATIRHGEKIAVVGRTGAGKSTILSAIFRLVEPQHGTVLIDGIDIRALSLKQLRSRITIVPQEPVLFSGTLRFNLDPTGVFADADLWAALEGVNCRSFVAELTAKLETPVVDFGENFSLGQRQLICMARAILHRSPVILMDEPTASMDLETDELVHQAMRKCFADSTVINISHRLGMIHEYDRVIVMDAGKIIEFDTPETLLADPSTVLAQLYAEYSQY